MLTPAVRARILSATRKKPSDGSTHWSCRKLASVLGVSKDAVHRVWQEAGLKPHRLERYMASDDPEFDTKAADILGLYPHPPQYAAVFCVDEKTAIQALDRLDPVLPLSPGRAERHGFWLNQVEIWFAKIEREVIVRGIFTSVSDLARKLRRHINAYSANARTIQWKYSDPTRRMEQDDAVDVRMQL